MLLENDYSSKNEREFNLHNQAISNMSCIGVNQIDRNGQMMTGGKIIVHFLFEKHLLNDKRSDFFFFFLGRIKRKTLKFDRDCCDKKKTLKGTFELLVRDADKKA